jgi:hypothetical protein
MGIQNDLRNILMTFPPKIFSYLLTALLLINSQDAFCNNLIRWVDDTGKVHYSDQVPPDQSKLRRETLNKQGYVVKITEAAKTKEQRMLNRKLKKLRKGMEKIIAKKKSRDQVLLTSFRSVEDIRQRLYEKLWALTTLQNIAQGNLKRVKKQLQNQRKLAAAHERDGREVPENLLKSLESTEGQIKLAQYEMAKLIEKKQLEQKNYDVDIDRFIFLTQPRDGEYISMDDEPGLIADTDLGLFICENEEQCDNAWSYAFTYVTKNSTTKIDIAAENLTMSYPPATDTDLSVSIAKLRSDNELTKIFLDIRCRKSLAGDLLCSSSKASDIRSSFMAYIGSSLKSENK